MGVLVFRTLTGTTRCFENSFLCFTFTAETLVVGDGTRLALATYYDTLYVSSLFAMPDSGGFPTFHSVLSFFVSMVFGRLCLYKIPYCSCFFSIIKSFGFIHSYRLLLRSIFRYKSILSLPLAELLLYGSEYHGTHPFTRYNYQYQVQIELDLNNNLFSETRTNLYSYLFY